MHVCNIRGIYINSGDYNYTVCQSFSRSVSTCDWIEKYLSEEIDVSEEVQVYSLIFCLNYQTGLILIYWFVYLTSFEKFVKPKELL